MSKIIGVTVGTPLNPAKFGGVSQTEKDLILSLFRNAAYTSANMGNTLTQLETLWSGSGDDSGGGNTHSHSYTSSVTTAATCITAGVKTYTCNCGHSYTESIPATGHNYVDGVCTVCGAADPTYTHGVTLSSISATYSGGSVPIGTAVNSLTGVAVTAHYSNGTSATVVGYTLSGTIAEGNNTITVTYEGKTATFVVVGANVLTSISAVYSGGSVAVGTALSDLTGIVVTAHYSDGTSEPVTAYTMTGTIAEGSNTITVSYGGKTTTFTVTGTAESGVDNIIETVTWTEGVLLMSGKEYTDETRANYIASDYVSTDGYESIVVENDTGKMYAWYFSFYDDTKTFISSPGTVFVQGPSFESYPSPKNIEIPDGTSFVRVSTTKTIGEPPVYYTDMKCYMV